MPGSCVESFIQSKEICINQKNARHSSNASKGKKIIIIGNWKRAISRMDTNEALLGRKEWNSFMKIAFQFFFIFFLFFLRFEKRRLNTDSLFVRTKRCFNQKNVQKRKIKEHENRECAIKGKDTISALWSKIKNGEGKFI